MGTLPQINDTIEDIKYEILQQHLRWGEQNHANVPKPGHKYGIPAEHTAKVLCEAARSNNRLTWAHILVEEVAEACNAPTSKLMIEELIQVAAVAVSWVDAIKRNG